MPNFSQRSLNNLAQCDPRLQQIASVAIQRIDFGVIVGHRSKEDQDRCCAAVPPLSHTPWPTSKHNATPSQAFDFIPSPFTDADWKNIARFREVADVLLAVASEMGIACRWGGNFTSLADNDHFELVIQ